MDWKTFKKQQLTSITANESEALDDLAILIDTLIKYRVDQNISQHDLAKMSGLAQSAVARFETCSVMPRIDTVAKIANALGCYLTVNQK